MQRKVVSILAVIVLVMGLLAGCAGDQQPADVKVQEADLIIVGGGAAGLMAALEAAEQGAEVILLEKMPFFGGNTIISAGIIQAAGTSVQRDYGIEGDTPEKFINDLVNPDSPYQSADRPLSWIMHEGAQDMVEFLRGRGLEFVDFEEANSRMHIVSPGLFQGGGTLISFLKDQAEAAGATLLLETTATELVTEDDRVVGVKATQGDEEVEFRGKAVLLATGGFSSNKEMVSQYLPDLATLESRAAVGITGDGVLMAEAIGADLLAMDAGQHMFYVNPKTGIDVPLLLAFTPAIIVNVEGERFIDESMDYCEAARAAVAQPEQRGYIIFDESVRAGHEPIEQYIQMGAVQSAETLEELAEKLELPQLVDTVTNYNDMVAAGEDAEFGRVFNFSALEEANFYAIEVAPYIYNSYGGLRIDLEGRVLDTNGQPIAGLYAGGEVTGSVEVQEGLKYTSGIAQGLVFGRLMAQTALADVE